MSMKAPIPEVRNRQTLRNGNDHTRHGVRYHIGHDNIGCASDGPSREYSEIQEQDGGLCRVDGNFVQDLKNQEVLLCKLSPISLEEMSSDTQCLRTFNAAW